MGGGWRVVLAVAALAPVLAMGADAPSDGAPGAGGPREDGASGGTGSATSGLGGTAAAPPTGPHALAAARPELRLVPDGAAGPLPAMAPFPGGPSVSGTAFIGWRGKDGETTGALATVSPGGNAFVRLAAEATPRAEGGASRLAWAAGFEDARAGTFFAEAQDRGPVRLDAGFTLRDAELSAGYKLPLLCAWALCLAPAALATVPLSGGPWIGARTTLALGRTWYAAAGLGWTVPGVLEGRGNAPRWRLQYGFGRWDARPGALFVAYRDELALARLGGVRAWRPPDRQARGVLTAGVTWAY